MSLAHPIRYSIDKHAPTTEEELLACARQAMLEELSQAEAATPRMAPEPEADRQTLIAFFASRDPSKLSLVDEILAKFRGREATMYEGLMQQYDVPRNNPYRDDIIRYYALHNPLRICAVDVILDLYKGKEDHLIFLLVNKYQPHSPLRIWSRYTDPTTGCDYYHNRITQEVQWERPSAGYLVEPDGKDIRPVSVGVDLPPLRLLPAPELHHHPSTPSRSASSSPSPVPPRTPHHPPPTPDGRVGGGVGVPLFNVSDPSPRPVPPHLLPPPAATPHTEPVWQQQQQPQQQHNEPSSWHTPPSRLAATERIERLVPPPPVPSMKPRQLPPTRGVHPAGPVLDDSSPVKSAKSGDGPGVADEPCLCEVCHAVCNGFEGLAQHKEAKGHGAWHQCGVDRCPLQFPSHHSLLLHRLQWHTASPRSSKLARTTDFAVVPGVGTD